MKTTFYDFRIEIMHMHGAFDAVTTYLYIWKRMFLDFNIYGYNMVTMNSVSEQMLPRA